MCKDWEQEQITNHDHFADLMALIANTNRDPERKPQPYKATDFAWRKTKKKKQEMTDDDIYNALRAAFGPDAIRRRKRN